MHFVNSAIGEKKKTIKKVIFLFFLKSAFKIQHLIDDDDDLTLHSVHCAQIQIILLLKLCNFCCYRT